MRRLKLVTGQVFTLSVVIGSLCYGELNARVLSFAFILLTLARLLTVQSMNQLVRLEYADLVEFLQDRFFGSPPHNAPPPYYRDGETGKPVGFKAHLLILISIFGTAFLLMHLDAKRELSFSASTFFDEMGWAAFLASVYWLSDLFAQDIIFDATRPGIDNLAYNNRSLTILAIAVLICAALIVVFQSQKMAPNPWLFYGPVLVLVHLTGLWRGFKAER